MSHMFCDEKENSCHKLSSLPDISNLDTKNVTDMSYIFYCCNSLSSLSDISNLDTKNEKDIDYMFFYCNSLS